MATNDPVNALIVEDDRSVQRFLADALTKQGFSVTVERDGEWALKVFEKKSYDVVLLDLLLPAINGYDVARQMRATARGRRTPIIMISGVYNNEQQRKEAIQKHGAFAFLEKPISLAALYETLRAALGDRYPQPRPVRPPPPPADDDEVTAKTFADPAAHEEVRHVESQVRRSASDFQAIRGELIARPFPEVLAEIHRWRGTGALLLRRDKVKKIIYFRQGQVQLIKSNLLSECLGQVMVRDRMISQAECEESLRRMKASGRQQGTVLIEMGCISPQNLVHALLVQLQTKLFDVFAWDAGDFQFNPKVLPPPETTQLEMTTAAVIYEGIRRCYDEARVKKALGPADSLYVHPSENPLYAFQDAGLGEEELQLLQAADGHKTVSTLRALAILPPLETDRFLYAMRCAQMIELRAEPSAKPKPSLTRLAELAPKPPPLPPPVPSAPPPPPVAAEPARTERAPIKARAVGPLLPELPGAFGPSSLSDEESLVRERLVNKVSQLRKLDYFEVLGVSTNASREEVKRAYFALAKEYHPDRHFGSSSAELRQLAGQIYDLISTAHDTLADPVERERYVKDLAAGVKRDIGDEVGKILAAEGKFQKGEELLGQRNVKGAHQLFREAIELYSEEGEFHAYYGWSLFQLAPNDPATVDEALKALERAVSLNPKVDKSYLFTGYIYKATGRPDKAEKQFEKAIQCNPDCTEALRELRLLGKPRR